MLYATMLHKEKDCNISKVNQVDFVKT